MGGRATTTVFLSAAEASGDAHAARLIEALRARLGGSRFVGAGGPRMAAAGCELIVDFVGEARMLAAAAMKAPYYWRQLRRIRRELDALRPDVCVPVDSPALNWHVAKAARKAGCPVAYYVAPQVWAWAPWRVKKLARRTTRVACILPFEEDYLRQRGVHAAFVGHPLLDALPDRPEPPPLPPADGALCVAMLPGSRPAEITAHADAMRRVAEDIRARWPGTRAIFTAVDDEAAERIRRTWGDTGGDGVELVTGRTSDVLAKADFAVVASGTATLQVAHFGVPMVVVYRASRLLYHTLGRLLLRTKHLSLVNILADRQLGWPAVAELMPWGGSVRQLSAAVMEALADTEALAEMRRVLPTLVEPLRASGGGTAADNAARIVCEAMRQDR